jgi:hypothetical protein
MKTLTRLAFIFFLTATLCLSACKKENESTDEDDNSTELIQQSVDESTLQLEMEILLNEINTAVSSSILGKTDPIAGATINDSTWIGEKKLVIYYNGKSADGKRNRIGTVIATLESGVNWGDVGAVLTIEYLSLNITNLATDKKIRFSGTLNITNSSGGRITSNSSVTHRIRGNVQLNFDDVFETSLFCQLALKRTITTYGEIIIQADTSLNGLDNISAWGYNRLKETLYTQIGTAIIVSSNCPGKVISGEKFHAGPYKTTAVKFGVDANGNPVTGTCPYGFKVSWINKRGEQKSTVRSY